MGKNNKEDYNWWTDPKNQEEVKRHTWWEHEDKKEFFNLPISVVQSDGMWTATLNSDTEKLLGDLLRGCGSGKTKKEAIKRMFNIIKITHEYSEERRLNYQRWVPLRIGQWSQFGGKWVVVFGIHIYFRYGKNMKGGFYIPLTKLNISISNEWDTYTRFIKKKQI